MKENINLIETIETKDEKDKTDIIAQLITYSVNQIDDPFKNITVNEVAKDLQIGRNAAYNLFKRDDFPSLNIGRSWKICYLAYLFWKLHNYKP